MNDRNGKAISIGTDYVVVGKAVKTHGTDGVLLAVGKRLLPASAGRLAQVADMLDHGGLSGLGDDDHTQYHTGTRHDAHDHSTALGTAVLDDLSNVSAASPFTNDVLQWSGSAWVNAGLPTFPTNYVRVLATDTTDRACSNTTTETTIFTYTVLANSLGTKGAVRVRLAGTFFQNSGATNTITLRLKFGSGTVWGDAWGATDKTATNALFVDLLLANDGSTSAQTCGGIIQVTDGAGSVTGYGNLGSAGGQTTQAFYGTGTQATSADKDLVLTAQWGTAHASSTITVTYAVVEFLPGV